MKKTKLSLAEVQEAKDWFEANRTAVPESIYKVLMSVFAVAAKILEPSSDLKMRKFLELLGFIPKSEKGSSLANQ